MLDYLIANAHYLEIHKAYITKEFYYSNIFTCVKWNYYARENWNVFFSMSFETQFSSKINAFFRSFGTQQKIRRSGIWWVSERNRGGTLELSTFNEFGNALLIDNNYYERKRNFFHFLSFFRKLLSKPQIASSRLSAYFGRKEMKRNYKHVIRDCSERGHRSSPVDSWKFKCEGNVSYRLALWNIVRREIDWNFWPSNSYLGSVEERVPIIKKKVIETRIKLNELFLTFSNVLFAFQGCALTLVLCIYI